MTNRREAVALAHMAVLYSQSTMISESGDFTHSLKNTVFFAMQKFDRSQ